MLGNQIFVLALLITGCYSADDNTNTVNVTNSDAILNETISSTTKLPASSTTTTEFPLLEDLVSAEKLDANDGQQNGDGNVDAEKSTAKRTISSKFTGPIVVGEEEAHLFTPADEFSRRQRINVQIIEPEAHNNGQYLKQTVFLRQENSTVVTSKTTTTSTTERPGRRKNIVVEQKLFAPTQVELQAINDRNQKRLNDDDCDDPTERTSIGPNIVVMEGTKRVQENVDIQQNTNIQKVIYKDEPRQNLVFGARVASTTRNPCDQNLPCSTARAYRPSSTPRPRTFNTTPLPPPRFYTTPRIVATSRVVTTPAAAVVSTVTPLPVRPVHTVTEKPVYIHTHSEVPVVQKEYVQLPPKIVERPIIHKQVVQLPPQVHVVHEKPKVVVQKEFIHLPPQEKIIPVEVEKLVVKEVPINNIIEKHIQHPPAVVEKLVPYPVASKPIEVEKIVQVPVDRFVEKPVPVNHVVEKPVAVPYVQYVDRPIHIPYIVPVEIPIAYHVPYLVKPQLPPPLPQKQHFIIKTTKYGKGHGFFDWKHNHLKHVKHVIIKKPNHIVPDELLAPPTIDSIGLLPPPRFQPYISDNFGPKTAASINVVQAVLPNSVHGNRDQFFEPSPLHNGFGIYDNKYKFVDSFAKDIRWEYGFKPPLVPSVEIDEFGNPLHQH